jgi:hypothetical protein
LSYSSSVRLIIGIAGFAAIGGLGACAVITGLSDYSEVNGTAPDGSVVTHRPEAGTAPDGGPLPGTDTGVGDDAGVSGDDGGEIEGGCSTTLDTTENCGACGVACELAKSTGAACGDGGLCTYTGCTPDWLDCDNAPPNANGCESSITSTASCGACGNTCDAEHSLGASCVLGDGGAPKCEYTGCAPGWADCDPSGIDTDGCETSLATAANCGACGKACDTKNSQGASCSDGATCSYTGCNANYFDCNTTPPDLDGCEKGPVTGATCNVCGGQSCDTTHSNGAACTGSTCTYTGCQSGYKDCNTSPPNTNGCDTQITTVQNCGNCGVSCDTSHSNGAACSSAACTYTGCAAGYADCFPAAPNTNGCETPLNSTSHCGGCGNSCSSSTGQPSCSGSTCTYKCNTGQSDCNAGKAPDTDGCECATPGCCNGGCQTVHNDGVGQNFFDCNGQGSHNQAQAQAACTAYTGNASACSPSNVCCGQEIFVCLGQTANSVCGSANGKCYCWQYSGPNPGRVESEGSSCKASCGSGSDPSWN